MKQTSPTTDQSASPVKFATKTSLGAFGLSILLHGFLILMVGGYVIFEGVVPKLPFIPVEEGIGQLDHEIIPPPDTPADAMDAPPSVNSELNPSASPQPTSTGESVSADLIVSSGTTNPFTLPVTVGSVGNIPKLGFGSGSRGTSTEGGGGTWGKTIGKGIWSQSFGIMEKDDKMLSGTMYDLKQTPDGKPFNKDTTRDFFAVIWQFIEGGLRSDDLREYFRSREIYTAQVYIPTMSANKGPEAFGLADKVQPKMWFIHYKGGFSPPKSGRYRFWGQADDVLIALVNGKVVMDVSIGAKSGNWHGKAGVNTKTLSPGDWMNLSENETYRLDLLVGEVPGGSFKADFRVEQEGVPFQTKTITTGNFVNEFPMLPVFATLPVEMKPSDKKNGKEADFPEVMVFEPKRNVMDPGR